MQKELFSEDLTVGELAEAAKNVAPGSIYIGGFKITHIATIPYDEGKWMTANRWCFTCRTVTPHSSAPVFTVGETTDTLPHEVHCLNCGGKDTDLFPGKEREEDQTDESREE